MDKHDTIIAVPASTTSPWFAGAMPCGLPACRFRGPGDAPYARPRFPAVATA